MSGEAVWGAGFLDPVDTDRTEVPPMVAAWVRQLLDPQFLNMLSTWPVEQVDVRLSASRGRVRPRPVVVLNGGPSEMVDP